MGRLKNSRKNVAQRNKLNIAKRNESGTLPGTQESVVKPKPKCQLSNNQVIVSNEPSTPGDNNRNERRPTKDPLTGFSLYRVGQHPSKHITF